MDNGKEIAKAVFAPHLIESPQYLVPVMTLVEAERWLKERDSFVSRYLIEGIDYGAIVPGSKQRSLLKPGADKLCMVYGLSVLYPKSRQDFFVDWERTPPYIKYTSTCVLKNERTGKVWECMGSCNSWEKKYKYRWQGRERVINEEICDVDNTLLKMSEKRALVGAVITATGSSGVFTQDMEDREEEERPARAQAKKPEAPPSPPPPQQHSRPGKLDPEILARVLREMKACATRQDLAKYSNQVFTTQYADAAKLGDNDAMTAIKNAANDRIAELKAAEAQAIKAEDFGEPGVFAS